MRQVVEALLQSQEHITQALKLWVVDKSIPLDERWDVFIKSGLGSTDRWSLNLDSLPTDAVMYEGIIHCDRYQTREVRDLPEELEDAIENWDHDYGHKEAKDIDLVAVKEEILKEFIYSFTYDW